MICRTHEGGWGVLGAAMGRLDPRLLALLVSLGASLAGSGGELCRQWVEGAESPAGAFPCAAVLDGADAAFCCGACHAPYCCSSAEARLDRDRCPGGDRLLVSSVPPANANALYSFYIGLGLTAAVMSGCIVYIIYRQICLPLRACIRARQQVRDQDMAPSRVSFQDPSPTFRYGVASRLRGHSPPPLYFACRAVRLSNLPLDNRDALSSSHTNMPAQPSQANSGTPGDDAARSSPAAVLLDMTASGGTPEPEEYATTPMQMSVMVPVAMLAGADGTRSPRTSGGL